MNHGSFATFVCHPYRRCNIKVDIVGFGTMLQRLDIVQNQLRDCGIRHMRAFIQFFSGRHRTDISGASVSSILCTFSKG
jgi:hypothetical protein